MVQWSRCFLQRLNKDNELVDLISKSMCRARNDFEREKPHLKDRSVWYEIMKQGHRPFLYIFWTHRPQIGINTNLYFDI